MPFKIPDSIWLQYYGEDWFEDDDGNLEKPVDDVLPEIGDVTWQDEKIFNSDIEFIRIDIANQRIAELDEHIDKIEHGAIFLGHPREYWLALNEYAYAGGYQKLIQDIAYHQHANEVAVNRITELEKLETKLREMGFGWLVDKTKMEAQLKEATNGAPNS